jgi:signal transduction histidine kinase
VAQALSLLGFFALRQADNGSWRLPVPVRIAAAAEALDRIPRDERDRMLVALNGDATRFYIGEEPPAGLRERRGPLPRLLESYGAALEHRAIRVYVPSEKRQYRPRRMGQAGLEYVLSASLADGSRLFVTPGPGERRRSLALAVLLITFAVATFAAFLGWRTVRGATQGLEAIARASDRFAVDLSAPPMAETGKGEARQVASAFNGMRARILTLMSERMRMLAAVAHDLKTLMTRLRLRVALIDDDEQRARADRDIALMATLIEDVLMVARGEEKPAPMKFLDVAALLTDVAHERGTQGQAVELGALGQGLVKANPSGLRRIIENLVENAVAYAGSAELSFERDQSGWRVLVVDHGPGMPAGFAERAFEPFERAETSRSRDTGGAGLGLSIAQTLARQMGASVRLEETVGGGVTSVVEAPA